jgi:hypothetical protein
VGRALLALFCLQALPSSAARRTVFCYKKPKPNAKLEMKIIKIKMPLQLICCR